MSKEYDPKNLSGSARSHGAPCGADLDVGTKQRVRPRSLRGSIRDRAPVVPLLPGDDARGLSVTRWRDAPGLHRSDGPLRTRSRLHRRSDPRRLRGGVPSPTPHRRSRSTRLVYPASCDPRGDGGGGRIPGPSPGSSARAFGSTFRRGRRAAPRRDVGTGRRGAAGLLGRRHSASVRSGQQGFRVPRKSRDVSTRETSGRLVMASSVKSRRCSMSCATACAR